MMDTETENVEMEEGENSDDEPSSQNSNSPEPSTDEEDVEESKIAAIEQQIKENPYLYESHVELINLRRKMGDLDELRKAREEMNKIFPLTPELWMDWLTDEEKLASSDDERKAIIALFERAVKDYTSVSVWLEYVQFMIGQMGSELGSENVRATFEKALSSVGIHVTEGSLIWDAYREFELAVLSTIECTSDDPEEVRNSKLKEQKNRLHNLYKRQLSIPLLHMERTYKEFQEMFPEQVDGTIDRQHQKACKKLEQITPFEDEVFSSEAPHLDEYKKYIQFEKEHGDPVRVQSLYERALLENCLVPDLWIEYTKYLDSVIKAENVVLPAYERAIRNCPWSVVCWKNYTMALERHSQPHNIIKGVYEKALSSGFSNGEEYREIWLGYLDYLRRRIKWDISHETELNDLNDVFDRAVEHIMTYFPESDSQCSILQYRAKIEAKSCKNITRAREIWNEIMNYGHHGEAEMWMNFANFEKQYGDDKHYRKLLLKGLHSASDWPESLGNLLLTFEREEGTLETLDVAAEKYESQMQRVQEKRQKRAEKEAEKHQQEVDRKAKAKADKKAAKLASFKESHSSSRTKKFTHLTENDNVKMDSDGFKIPFAPSRTSSEKRESFQVPKQTMKRSADQPLQREDSKKPKAHHKSIDNIVSDIISIVTKEECQLSDLYREESEETEDTDRSHGQTVQHDSLKDERTVFLSNLAYTTDEDEIRETFCQVGALEEVRLVRDYKGRSKGYCYVVYSSKVDAVNALKKDRSKLSGRPVFVSPCHYKKSGSTPQQKFKFGTGLEKNKLFVKGLPPSSTEDDLKEIFKQYGKLKEVRIVTYRNGHSKGIAYVEYECEADAATALVKTDGSQVGEQTISVAISNPPVRKQKSDQMRSGVTVSSLLGGGGSSSGAGPRGKGRTQLSLLPRALQRPVQPPKSSDSSTQETTNTVQNGDSNGTDASKKEEKLSNADFRSMLLKKS